jgi:hypothetical protein
MDVTTVNLIIIVLTVAIMSGIARSLSSRGLCALRSAHGSVHGAVVLWRGLSQPVSPLGLQRPAGIRTIPATRGAIIDLRRKKRNRQRLARPRQGGWR